LALGGKASVGSVDVVDTLVVNQAFVPDGASVVGDDTSSINGDATAGDLALVTLVLLRGTNLDTSAVARIDNGPGSLVVAAEGRVSFEAI